MKDYKYDVFLSFTGGDRELKTELRERLEAPEVGLHCYDSDLYCKGPFREDFCEALDQSRVYLMILSDNLRNDPAVTGRGSLSEVRRECGLACELEAKNELNIVILCLSEFFFYDKPFHDVNDQIGWLFYSHTRGFSQVRGRLDPDGTLAEFTISDIISRCRSFVDKRNAGHPDISQAPHIEIAQKKLSPSGVFKGRTDEIDAAISAFSEGRQAVVLSGIGGMGKTTLATEIARRCEESGYLRCPQIVHIRDLGRTGSGLHTVVSSVSYEKQVYESLSTLPEADKYERKLSALADIPETYLLVIDNYNTLSEDDIDELLGSLKCRLLITTRAPIPSDGERLESIQIGSLGLEQAYEMFCEVGKSDISRESFKTLYDYVGGHTITLCIMAKMSYAHKMSPEALLSEMRALNSSDARIEFKHNEHGESDTFLGHLRSLFDISDFGEGARRILRSMSLLAGGSIKTAMLESLLGLKNRNDIIALEQSGWLDAQIRTEDGIETEYLYLHPILSRLSASLLSPSSENAREMIDYLVSSADDGDPNMTYSDATLMADGLYYACHLLAESEHKLPRELWERFTELNHLLGDSESTAEKSRELSALVDNDLERSVVTAYSDMITLEQYPTRVDLLDKYLSKLNTNAHDYRWVMRQLSVTIPHIIGSEQNREFLSEAMDAALSAAMEQKDDFAVFELMRYAMYAEQGFKRAVRRIRAYTLSRKREGVNSASIMYLDMLTLYVAVYDVKNPSELDQTISKIISLATEEKWLPMIGMTIRHPIAAIKTNRLWANVDAADPNEDPLVLPLQLTFGAAMSLIDNGRIDSDMIIEAAIRLHNYRLEQQATLATASEAIGSVLNVMRLFPEAAVKKGTARIAESVDLDNVSVRSLSSLQVAMMINREYQNRDAIEQSKLVIEVTRRIRPEGHGDIITAMMNHADICYRFGDPEEAARAYTSVYTEMFKRSPDSSLLSELAYKLLRLPSTSSYSFEKLSELRNVAIGEKSAVDPDRYSVIAYYSYRLLEKSGRGEVEYNDSTVWGPLKDLLTLPKKTLRTLPALAASEALRAIDYIVHMLINQRQFALADSFAELLLPFKRYAKKGPARQAEAYMLSNLAYASYHKGEKNVDIPALFDRATAYCVKHRIMSDIAEVSTWLMIARQARQNEMPLLGTYIKSKKHREPLEKYVSFIRETCFSGETVAENTPERLDEIFNTMLPTFIMNRSNELHRDNFGISARQYTRFKSVEEYYALVLRRLLDAVNGDLMAKPVTVRAKQ